jgi:hypothetical protein
MVSIEHNIRKNFESRLKRAQESFERNQMKPIMQKLLELHEVSYISIYDLFSKQCGCGFEGTLEGFENICSIVDNFYDDSYYKVIWEVPETIILIRTREDGSVDVTDDDKRPYIFQSFDDDDEVLNEQQFCEIIQWRIDKARRFMEIVNANEKRN